MSDSINQPIVLTKNEHAVMQRMSNGENMIDAVQDVYKSTTRTAAAQTANRILKRDRFIAVMEAAGITDIQLAAKFMQLLNQKKPVVIGKSYEMFDDGAIQLGTLKTIVKVKGYMDDEAKTEQNGEPLIIHAIKWEGDNVIINQTSSSDKEK